MFNKVLRLSALGTVIDALSPAILNTSFSVDAQQRLTTADLNLNVLRDYTINFPMPIAKPDDVNYIISSTNFTYTGKTCIIRNKLNTTTLEVIEASSGNIILDNAGSYNPSNGTINLAGLTISSFEGSSWKINAKPANVNTIKPLRNYILEYDALSSSVQGIFDYQNTAVTIS